MAKSQLPPNWSVCVFYEEDAEIDPIGACEAEPQGFGLFVDDGSGRRWIYHYDTLEQAKKARNKKKAKLLIEQAKAEEESLKAARAQAERDEKYNQESWEGFPLGSEEVASFEDEPTLEIEILPLVEVVEDLVL